MTVHEQQDNLHRAEALIGMGSQRLLDVYCERTDSGQNLDGTPLAEVLTLLNQVRWRLLEIDAPSEPPGQDLPD